MKQPDKSIRIGYINLHESHVSAKDLQKLASYDCDVWLFLEWNGNNLDLDPRFTEAYKSKFETADAQTFGVAVLSKQNNIEINEVDKEKRPYNCDYPKFRIRTQGMEIYLVHAPPPVPGCNFETSRYIEDLAAYLKNDDTNARLIVGDLNLPPVHSAIQLINAMGFKDTEKSLSNWPQGTFAPFTWLPKLVKFDYVFHNQYVHPLFSGRFSTSNSDHSGWIIDYELPNTSKQP